MFNLVKAIGNKFADITVAAVLGIIIEAIAHFGFNFECNGLVVLVLTLTTALDDQK